MASALLISILVVEAALIATSLFLFSYGYPEETRLALWEEGAIHLFNSDPRLRVYFFANHQVPPKIPYIWSQSFSDFNIAVAVLTLGVFVSRCSLRAAGVFNTATECFLQCCVLPFWIVALTAQNSTDYSDEEHPSRTPWYLTHSCSIVQTRGHRAACHVGQASFAVINVIVVFYACWIWKTAAYAGFDYMLARYKTADEEKADANTPMTEVEAEGYWSDDESPLMRACDDL